LSFDTREALNLTLIVLIEQMAWIERPAVESEFPFLLPSPVPDFRA
jgi:hypothetical protein